MWMGNTHYCRPGPWAERGLERTKTEPAVTHIGGLSPSLGAGRDTVMSSIKDGAIIWANGTA